MSFTTCCSPTAFLPIHWLTCFLATHYHFRVLPRTLKSIESIAPFLSGLFLSGPLHHYLMSSSLFCHFPPGSIIWRKCPTLFLTAFLSFTLSASMHLHHCLNESPLPSTVFFFFCLEEQSNTFIFSLSFSHQLRMRWHGLFPSYSSSSQCK